MFRQQDDLLYGMQGEGDTEALQTDIQRFIAILGFCLMAIFALVQAIPVTSHEKETVIDDLSQRVVLQKEELDHLKSENERLKEELNRLAQYAGISRSLADELTDVEKKLELQAAMIAQLSSEKVERQRDLVATKRELETRDRKISRLMDEKTRAEQLLEKLRKALNAPKPAKKEPSRIPRKAAEQRGLYVAFESDRVFMDLLGSGKISLFIKVMDAGQGFKVISRGGMIDFKLGVSTQCLDLWEVKESMVPSRIIEEFKNWTTLASRKKMLIVGLTSEISRQIRERKTLSGSFIIRSGGKVTYSPDEG